MKIVISPAKSLDFESPLPTKLYSEYGFQKQSLAIDAVLKKKSPKQLSDLMSISDKLSDLNWQRNQLRNVAEITTENARPAIYAFSGDVYIGLDSYSLSEEKINLLQDQLRILSGLYGLLKPLDLMQPYRLEMGTSLPVSTKEKNLYAFWKEKLTKQLIKELSTDEVIINLASAEYSKAIDFKKITNQVITPTFKEFKNGKFSTVMIFAKHARGKMSRYLIENDLKEVEELKLYTVDNYEFSATQSTDNEWVFVR